MQINCSLLTFILHCTRLALSLKKIGCGSAMKMKVYRLSFCIALALHYLCK